MEHKTRIESTPFMADGKEIGVCFDVTPEKKYVVFVKEGAVDLESLCTDNHNCFPTLPAGTPIYVMFPVGEETIDDAIRIFELEQEMKK